MCALANVLHLMFLNVNVVGDVVAAHKFAAHAAKTTVVNTTVCFVGH